MPRSFPVADIFSAEAEEWPMSPWKRVAGCRTRGCDNQRFRPRRWTFARKLEGHIQKDIAPDNHPDAGVPVVLDHERATNLIAR